MGVILIGVLAFVFITILLGLLIRAKEFHQWALSGLFGLIGGIVVTLLLNASGEVAETEKSSPTRMEISAINDGGELLSSFALGFGSIKGRDYYYYVIKDEDGFKKIRKAEVRKSKIKEGSQRVPYVLIFESKYKTSFNRWMYGEFSGEKVYEFYVPTSTVTSEYKVDLE